MHHAGASLYHAPCRRSCRLQGVRWPSHGTSTSLMPVPCEVHRRTSRSLEATADAGVRQDLV